MAVTKFKPSKKKKEKNSDPLCLSVKFCKKLRIPIGMVTAVIPLIYSGICSAKIS